MAPRESRGAVSEEAVTFTVLEDGLYLPSVGGVLPEGEYSGRKIYRDGKLSEVYITLHRRTMDAMGVDKGGKGSLNWNIINDYLAQMIGEDKV